MNKYEEAFIDVKKVLSQIISDNLACISNHQQKDIGIIYAELDENESIKDLQELVKRATPMKPLPHFMCPKCKGIVADEFHNYKYCENCGQALDWSDEK